MKRTLILALCLLAFFTNAQDCSELFFSEYVEGSFNNKALEIYNPTQEVIDLSNYKIERYSNGSNTTSDEMSLNGTIASGEAIVITNSDTNSTNQFGYIFIELYNMADILAPLYPSPLYMNGNDAIVLSKNGVIIDIIGKIGENPGEAWTDDAEAGFTDSNGGTYWTQNQTLIRKETILKGVFENPILFNPTTEWDSLPNMTWTDLGVHDCDCIDEQEVSSWNCVDEACVELMDESGAYSSLEDCETECTQTPEQSWNCVDEACVELADESGTYSSLEDCETACANVSSIQDEETHFVSPNPSNLNTGFSIHSNEQIELIKLIDLSGKVVLKEFLNGVNFKNVSTSHLSVGTYILSIQFTNGNVSKEKHILK